MQTCAYVTVRMVADADLRKRASHGPEDAGPDAPAAGGGILAAHR